MRIISSLLILSIFVITGCDKDKFTTIPQVKIKSIRPNQVFNGDVITLKGEFTDQEGDIDSALIVYKWYNGATEIPIDTFRYTLENFDLPPKTRQADITVDFEYNTNNIGIVTLPGVGIRDTTAAFGLIFIDKANNRSSYVESDPIRLIKP